jgi:hypothetical protein
MLNSVSIAQPSLLEKRLSAPLNPPEHEFGCAKFQIDFTLRYCNASVTKFNRGGRRGRDKPRKLTKNATSPRQRRAGLRFGTRQHLTE